MLVFNSHSMLVVVLRFPRRSKVLSWTSTVPSLKLLRNDWREPVQLLAEMSTVSCHMFAPSLHVRFISEYQMPLASELENAIMLVGAIADWEAGVKACVGEIASTEKLNHEVPPMLPS